MKSSILAFAICMTLIGTVVFEPVNAGWSAIESSNSGTGPGGTLQDNTPQDLTDCCGNSLSAR